MTTPSNLSALFQLQPQAGGTVQVFDGINRQSNNIPDWAQITGRPESYPPGEHTHLHNVSPYRIARAATVSTWENSPAYTNQANTKVGFGATPVLHQVELTESLGLMNTTNAYTGVIYKGVTPFIHNFAPANSLGGNTFVGLNCGNFSATANPSSNQSEQNTGVGADVLSAITTAYWNTVGGAGAGRGITTGWGNTLWGLRAGELITDGVVNTGIGYRALGSLVSGTGNFAGGISAGKGITSGSNNTFVGANSGEGAYQKLDAVYSSGFGFGAYTTKDNQIVIGDVGVIETLLRGKVGINTVDPVTQLEVKITTPGADIMQIYSATGFNNKLSAVYPADAIGVFDTVMAGAYGANGGLKVTGMASGTSMVPGLRLQGIIGYIGVTGSIGVCEFGAALGDGVSTTAPVGATDNAFMFRNNGSRINVIKGNGAFGINCNTVEAMLETFSATTEPAMYMRLSGFSNNLQYAAYPDSVYGAFDVASAGTYAVCGGLKITGLSSGVSTTPMTIQGFDGYGDWNDPYTPRMAFNVAKRLSGQEYLSALESGDFAFAFNNNGNTMLRIRPYDGGTGRGGGVEIDNNQANSPVNGIRFLGSTNVEVPALGTASARLLKAVDANGKIELATPANEIIGQTITISQAGGSLESRLDITLSGDEARLIFVPTDNGQYYNLVMSIVPRFFLFMIGGGRTAYISINGGFPYLISAGNLKFGIIISDSLYWLSLNS